MEADLGDGFIIGIRGATGENDSPVTENQTLGVANGGQGGNFSRYSLWLDRAFLRYELGGRPNQDLMITAGRFDNPFFSTTMIWAEDLGFDGFLLRGRYQVLKGVTPYLTMGIFPVFNTDLNFATNNPSKFNSEDKWLYAGQIGTTWRISRDFSMNVGLALYHFENILFVNYRYVESDAVVDGFCDSDFGNGGTNLKGFEVGGSLALSSNVWLTLRWLSANEVAGPPYKNDILQVDINGRF